MLTKSDLEQIKNYLALYSKKDSQLEAVPVNLDYPEVTFEANDYLSVVQDSKNKTIKIKDLEKVFLLTFLTDEDFREALKGKIPEEMLENACVTTEKLADGAVTTIKLGDNAVTTAKIATGAITGDKIVNNTIQGSAFAANSITTDKIVDGTVTGDKLADESIQNVNIKDNTLSGSKFIDSSISGSKIQDNVIESKHLLDNSVPGSKIKDGSIESVDIKDGTLDGAKIKDNTIESAKLANNAITTDKIIDNSITTGKIANDAVTEDKIVDNSITTNKIVNSSVTTDKIVDEAITEDKLADGAVTTAKLADGLISDIQNITDATPTTGSVKPVQSGGVYNEIALGAVYDVSAKNPTGGPNNDGKWESFSALLSEVNLNNLIPTSVRKGGMSIKFVQSSDNKYVQFRYMSSSTGVADFTNFANWQGVTGDVKSGNKDYITSDGVSKSILYLTGIGTDAASGNANNVGDVYYNSNVKTLRKVTSTGPIATEVVPFYDGTLYSCNNDLYIYNGTDLVNKTKVDNSLNPNSDYSISNKTVSIELSKEVHLGDINMSLSPTLDGIITDSSGKWKQVSGFTSIIIPVSPDLNYSIKAKNDTPACYAFLKEMPSAYDTDVDFVDGETRTLVVSADSTVIVKSQSDAKYLYLQKSTSSNPDILPTVNVGLIDEIDVVNSSMADCAFGDEGGNIVLAVMGGDIVTKNFNSGKAQQNNNKPYSTETIRFTVPVNVNFLKNSEDALTLQDSYAGNYYDNGLLMLPESYSQQGTPTRLVMFFHGGGGGATDHDSLTENSKLAKYLVANGYAVMDMNGMPSDWVETWWSDFDTIYAGQTDVLAKKSYIKVNNMGTPLTMECYLKGYQYVIDNYNICKDGVLVCGGSMGGLSSTNFVQMGSVKVLAHALLAPVLDTYNQAFLHAWTPYQFPTGVISRYALSKLYGFSQKADISETTEIDGYNIQLIYNYDETKVTGYNPIVNGMQTFLSGERVTSVGTWDYNTSKLNGETVTEYKKYPCPLKIWHCDDDPTVNVSVSERQINAIRNAGGMAWIRNFPSGGHNPEGAGTAVSNPTGNTTYKGVSIGTIYPAVEETFLYFNRFK